MGASFAVAVIGAVLALIDMDTPLRGPFTLFFLLAAPAGAIAATLRGLDPWGRVVACVAGACALNLLVAEAMLALHLWSIRGGVVAVAALSCAMLLPALVRSPRARTARKRTS